MTRRTNPTSITGWQDKLTKAYRGRRRAAWLLLAAAAVMILSLGGIVTRIGEFDIWFVVFSVALILLIVFILGYVHQQRQINSARRQLRGAAIQAAL